MRFSDCTKLNKLSQERAINKNDTKQKWSQSFKESVITEKNFVSKIYEVAKSQKIKVPMFILKNEKKYS